MNSSLSDVTVEAEKNFSITSEKVSFDKAASKCAEIGLHFARVETADEETRVRSLMNQLKRNYPWIALKKSVPFSYGSVRYYQEISNIIQYLRWNDGSQVSDFSLTKNDLAFYEYYQYCVIVDTSSGEAKMSDTYCTSNIRALCKKGKL